MSVIVTLSARETFTPRELTDAYKQFKERGAQYLSAETGIRAATYQFGERVLLVYQESETDVVVLIHPSAWNRNSRKFVSRILHSPIPIQAEKYRFPGRAPNRKSYMLWRCIKMQQSECEAACSERRCRAGCSSHLRRTCDGKTALPGKTPTVSEISNPDYS
jgi:hypothetical protein